MLGILPSQSPPLPISALSPAPSVASVVTPVILTLPQEADSLRVPVLP